MLLLSSFALMASQSCSFGCNLLVQSRLACSGRTPTSSIFACKPCLSASSALQSKAWIRKMVLLLSNPAVLLTQSGRSGCNLLIQAFNAALQRRPDYSNLCQPGLQALLVCLQRTARQSLIRRMVLLLSNSALIASQTCSFGCDLLVQVFSAGLQWLNHDFLVLCQLGSQVLLACLQCTARYSSGWTPSLGAELNCPADQSELHLKLRLRLHAPGSGLIFITLSNDCFELDLVLCQCWLAAPGSGRPQSLASCASSPDVFALNTLQGKA